MRVPLSSASHNNTSVADPSGGGLASGRFRAEVQLVLRCARPVLDHETRTAVRALVQGPLDWVDVAELAEHHRILPLLWRHLEADFADFLPAPVRQRLGQNLRGKVAQSFLLAAELRRILQHFAAEGIASLAYKGPAMAQQVYRDIALRTFGDLDVVVRKSDLGRAQKALAALGYHPALTLTPAQEAAVLHGECDRAWINRRSGARVELHWAIAAPNMSLPMSTDALLGRAQITMLLGQPVATPAREDLLLLLAVNGGKDLWQRIEPACLISVICADGAGLDWDGVLARARQLRAERLLRLALTLAGNWLGAQLPPSVRDWRDRDRAVAPLVQQAGARWAARPARAPSVGETMSFRIRSREHWADGLRHCALRAALPTARDCGQLPLPAALWPAAGLIRPWRLLRAALDAARRNKGSPG